MRRRDFLSGLGAIAWPRGAAAAVPPTMMRAGIVHPVSPKGVPPDYVAFIGRLNDLGYVEGTTLAVEYINLEGHIDRFDAAMRELVRRRVNLIFALGQEDNLRAAMAATSTIPIVMLAIGFDPVAEGYVKSLAQPGGNVTGLYVLSIEVAKKRLQLFKDAIPELSKAFGFWDFDAADAWRSAEEGAPALGLTLAGIELRDPPYDYERAFEQVAPDFRGAMFLVDSVVFTRDADRIAAFALRHRIASCFGTSRLVDAGGLMSYSADSAAAARRAAELADRIMRGAKPADLPIEQPTAFTLKINLKTATALGIAFPPQFLARADAVIE